VGKQEWDVATGYDEMLRERYPWFYALPSYDGAATSWVARRGYRRHRIQKRLFGNAPGSIAAEDTGPATDLSWNQKRQTLIDWEAVRNARDEDNEDEV